MRKVSMERELGSAEVSAVRVWRRFVRAIWLQGLNLIQPLHYIDDPEARKCLARGHAGHKARHDGETTGSQLLGNPRKPSHNYCTNH